MGCSWPEGNARGALENGNVNSLKEGGQHINSSPANLITTDLDNLEQLFLEGMC